MEAIEAEALQLITATHDEAALRDLEVRFLGKKGELTDAMKMMRELSPQEKPVFGAKMNAVRAALELAIAAQQAVHFIGLPEGALALAEITVRVEEKSIVPALFALAA